MNYNEALNAVKVITAQNGTDILYEKDRLPSLFKDLAPGLEDEYGAIKIFYDNELYKAFSETSDDDQVDRENTISVLKRRLTSEFSVNADLADEIINVLIAALGWNTANTGSNQSETVEGFIRRVMNNKKKLYILLAVAAAIVAMIIILIVALPGKPSKHTQRSTPKNIASEAPIETDAPENDAAEEGDAEPEPETEGEPEGVQIEIPVEELGKLVDAADEAYKSFEVVPVDSADFFLEKKLRLVATLQDDDSGSHTMTFLYDQNITATVTDSVLAMNYKNSEGNNQTLANYVYAAPSEAFTSPGGRKFAMVAFGDHEITEENKEFSTDCFMLIKMREDVDMSIAPADTYVLLIESSMPEVYELFRVEE